jgi:uridylate kinase
MSARRLQELLDYAWETFYQDEPQELKMFKLLKKVAYKEMAENTYRKRDRTAVKFGKD